MAPTPTNAPPQQNAISHDPHAARPTTTFTSSISTSTSRNTAIMRWQSSAPTCGLGLAAPSSRSAQHQDAFARRRLGGAMKRKGRDDDTGSSYEIDAHGNRVLLDGLKRMRVTSPPSSQPSSPVNVINFPAAPAPTTPTTIDDVAMNDDDYDDQQSGARRRTGHHQAIIPVSGTNRQSPSWTATSTATRFPFEHAARWRATAATSMMDMPNDPSSLALVVFDPHRALRVERSPRVELVNDDSDTEWNGDHLDSDDQSEGFVRFEELAEDEAPEDDGEAMDLD